MEKVRLFNSSQAEAFIVLVEGKAHLTVTYYTAGTQLVKVSTVINTGNPKIEYAVADLIRWAENVFHAESVKRGFTLMSESLGKLPAFYLTQEVKKRIDGYVRDKY